ncbi:MAG: hypothetical protein Q4C73_09320 [Eubacteriales bacterium]|nr:hypothetical protein [Eubacteriales bacterium]
MLAPEGTTLRTEQNRLTESLYGEKPEIVCQARCDILCMLAACGAADTILPLELLPMEAKERTAAFDKPQPYYLLEVFHPGRTLPPSTADLSGILEQTLRPYFSCHQE